MRKIFTLFSLLLIGKIALAQDVSVIAITAPVSGCSLSATSSVTISVRNVGLTDLSGVPFDLSYTIDAGAPVTDLGVSFASFASNTTVSYTFTVPADLSLPATYTFTAFSTLGTDINTTNDAFTGYTVTSTALSVGGTVAGGTNVCNGANSGSLTLSGHTGSVLNWEYSIDGGTTWISISNTGTTQSYLNLTVPTRYRAQVQNGVCASTVSSEAIMTIDPSTVAGTVTGSTTVCSGANSGVVNSGGGRVGSILKWQFSIDGGSTWTDIANTTASQSYLNLTQTTRYRLQVQSGSCVALFSPAATITVNPPSVGGTVSGGTTVCSGTNSGNLTLAGHTGSVTRWEFSTNAGVSWTNITNTTTTQSYLNLTATRWFRAFVTSAGCTGTYSSIDSIVVNPVSVGGTISSAATVCSGANSGTLTLAGNTGTVQYWEFSTDGGATYTTIANITNTQSYLNLTATTIYRANVKSGACAATNSGTVTITVSPISVGGTTTMNDTVCSGSNSGTITLSGNIGTVSNWQSSTDGITWTTIANTTTSQSYLNISSTTYYQANVTSGACPSALSSIDTITIDVPSVGGSVTASANVCYGNNGDTLFLTGHTGNVVRWEYSTDGGINWISISNTTPMYIYSNIIITTVYRAVVQNGACSSVNSGVATLTVNPVSVGGTISGSTTVCGGANSGTLNLFGYVGSVTMWESSVDGGVTWTPIANTTAAENYLNLLSTTMYRAIVVSGVCSSDTSLTATIIVDSPPIGGNLVANDTVCAGVNSGTLTLTGYVGTIINWETTTDGVTWFALSNTTNTQSYLNLMTTTYYRAFVNSGVCLGTISNIDTITVDAASVAGTITGAASGCEGANSGTLTATGTVGSVVDWESSVDGGATWVSLANTTTTQTYLNLVDTTWYRIIVQSNMCTADTSAPAMVIVYPKPVGAFTADTVCYGNATTFTNTSTIPSGFIQFNQWDFGDGNNSLAPSPTHTYGAAGTFTVSLMLTSNQGCLDTVSVNVVVNALPSATISASGPLGFCAGDTLTLSAVAGAFDYLWSTTDTVQSLSVSTAGTFVLTITDSVTGCMNMDSVTTIVYPSPSVSAGADVELSLGNTVDLEGSGSGVITWFWFPNTGLTNASISNPTAAPLVTTMYTLTGTDANGCMDVDTMTITVVMDYNVTISNLMTPNDDGYNDRWVIQNIENYPDTKVIVVNREGQEVFSSDAYDNNWDGTTKTGGRLPDGTYYYVIQFANDEKILKGAITILKEGSK
ncbi:MAG: gliding motility-associated C-terminal domain-containing protein [Bacteroidetes bacterium]|nr:gliding motility-associated C-terminal domain-containing protein [Bacteroidota bacterium]